MPSSMFRCLALFACLLSQAVAGAAVPERGLDVDIPQAVSAPAKPDALKSDVPVRMGIPFAAFSNSESSLLRDTVLWLKAQFGNQLDVLPFHDEEMREAVARGGIDVFVSSAGLYREFANAGSKDLATLSDLSRPDPNSSMAAAVIVRKDRADLMDIDDLEGGLIACSSADFESGWLPFLYEIRKRGHREGRFFRESVFTGTPMSQAVDMVLSGQADAAVVSSCYFEEMSQTLYPGAAELRVLAPQDGGGLSCARSTRAYPGMTIATMPSANPHTMRAITFELFSMPASGAAGAEWSVATDFHETDELLKTLAVGPYRHLREWTVNRLLSEYRSALIVLVIAALGVIIHSVRTEYVVHRRTSQLKEAMAVQERMRAEAEENTAQIELLSREGVVQQLSSMVAHELRQPMTAIGLFTKGLISRISRGEFDRESFLAVLGRIRDLNHQSNSIVEHVRGYARAKISRVDTDISDLVGKAVQTVVDSRFWHGTITIETDIEQGVFLVADPLEIRLIVTNLMKNAAEACAGVPEPRIAVTLKAKPGKPSGLAIRIEDNGPPLSEEAISMLGQPFKTTKAEGLGLGISMVRRIAESYGGRLSYRACHSRGLVAEVILWNPLIT